MSESILVTGGAGFIGSHIVDALVAAGHTVAVLDNLSTGKRENVNPAATLYEMDLRDAPGVRRVVDEVRPAVISHQAALADVRASLADPATYAQVNVVGTLNLLEAARRTGATRKVIFASTGGAVYGNPAELPATERCPALPLDPYGTSKLACEYYLATYKHNYDIDHCILRYANVYGPRQDPFGEAGVVAIWTERMLHGKVAVINGSGDQQRDFCYVGDVARGNVLALTRGSGEIYNLGTGVSTAINQVYALLREITGYDGPEVHGPAKHGEVWRIYLNVDKAREGLGWEPQVPLREGLQLTMDYFR